MHPVMPFAAVPSDHPAAFRRHGAPGGLEPKRPPLVQTVDRLVSDVLGAHARSVGQTIANGTNNAKHLWGAWPDARASRGKLMRRPYKRIGWPTIAGLVLVVVAFMVLSLLVTATGTARFAVAMGYDARIGYVVGAAFEFAKEVLPVALLALLAQRAFGAAASSASPGSAWWPSAALQRTRRSAPPSPRSSGPAPGRWKYGGIPRRS